MARQSALRVVDLTTDEEAAYLREMARRSAQWALVDEAYTVGPLTRWFAVYTAPRGEKRAMKGFKRQKLISYMPIAATWREQSRVQKHQRERKVRIERPVWPGYVFVALPVKLQVTDGVEIVRAPFEMLRKTDGVSDIVGDGMQPLQIRGAFIDKLRAREDRGEFDDTVKKGRIISPKWVTVGAAVTIEDGPFACFSGLVDEILPREMVKVCVFIFGRTTPLLIEIDRIRPL
jgi:transcription antitermination factor NusG